jgi:serine/threonine protein kinase
MSHIKETLDAKVTTEKGHRTLNQYQLIKELGSGSYGTVHLAINTTNNQKVAIKECSKSKLRKQKQQAQLGNRGRGRGRGTMRRVTISRPKQAETSNPIDLVRSEVAILKKLEHKHIVKLYEVLDDPQQDSLFMVFELCENGCCIDLKMNESVTPLSPSQARDYFQQLILGIEYRMGFLI